MEDEEEYEDENLYHKINIARKIFKFSLILILIIVIYNLRDKDITKENDFNLNQNNEQNKTIQNKSLIIDVNNINNKNNTNNNNDNNNNDNNTTKNNNNNNDKINSDNQTQINIIPNITNIINGELIKISTYNHISYQNYPSDFQKVVYFNMPSFNYSFSNIFNKTKFEYNIGIYDEKGNLYSPSNLTLHYDLKFICFMEIPNLNQTIYSIANNYENKYINCKEYFNLGEEVKYGIRIYNQKSFLILYLPSENIINYDDINHTNDNMFDPDKIKQDYISSYKEAFTNAANKSYYLKREYLRPPNLDLRRNNASFDENWNFNNFYNDYFCFCVGDKCFEKEVTKQCKYLFYMTIIEKYKNLYPKTEYVFADFIFNYLSSDDAYPIFQEMIEQHYPAHYITENQQIIDKYCPNDIYLDECEPIIYVNTKIYIDYADSIEKYLTLILKTKAFITCRSTDSNKVGFLLYMIDYITYIAIGHGVCYFKDYLFSNRRIYGPDMNDKVLIPPSEPLIAIAVKFGWNIDNIIKINLPKWDKYDGNNKVIIENYNNNIANNSILIMFTYRMTRIAWNYNMSQYYFENITKLIFNERLQKELKENNITLYFSLHRMVNPGYQKKYKQKLKQYNNVKVLQQNSLSECLSKTNLVITDFSSILFDLMYRNKPFIIYLPDGDDPLIDQLYTPDYINLIKRMNNREFNIANICNNVEETVDKIIYYIKNKFQIDRELKKFFDYIGLKNEGSNIQKFIDYLTAL